MAFKIDGVDIPTPITFKPSFKERLSDDSDYTLDGIYQKEIIRVMTSYEVEFGTLTWAEASTLLNAVLNKNSIAFYHPDPRISTGWITRNFYVTDLDCPPLTLKSGKETWSGISFTLEDIGDD